MAAHQTKKYTGFGLPEVQEWQDYGVTIRRIGDAEHINSKVYPISKAKFPDQIR